MTPPSSSLLLRLMFAPRLAKSMVGEHYYCFLGSLLKLFKWSFFCYLSRHLTPPFFAVPDPPHLSYYVRSGWSHPSSRSIRSSSELVSNYSTEAIDRDCWPAHSSPRQLSREMSSSSSRESPLDSDMYVIKWWLLSMMLIRDSYFLISELLLIFGLWPTCTKLSWFSTGVVMPSDDYYT